MLELVAFGVMASTAYIALIVKKRMLTYGWFILYALYSLIVRLSPAISSDMTYYYHVAQNWPPSVTFFTLREPVFYFVYPSVLRVLGDRTIAFLVMDLVCGLIIFRAMKEFDDGDGRTLALAPVIISSYVFLLGQQNVLRQHLGLIILLWSLAGRTRHRRSALVLFVLSALAHNMALVFFGYWFDMGREKRSRYGLLFTATVVVAVAVGFSGWKSAGAFGVDTRYLYVAVATTLVGLLLYASTGRFSSLPVSMLHFMVFIPAGVYLASAPFERLAMVFMVLIVIEVYRRQRSLHLDSELTGHFVYALLVVPTILFASTRGMLT